MAIIKPTDPLPKQSVVVLLYGTPGCGKTSTAITAGDCLLIDTDRGSNRAVSRCDTLYASSWADIEKEMEAMKGYKVVIVDTAKSMIDDYLSDYVISQNYKLKTNALKRYGQMGEEFKAFVSRVRANDSDLIFVCHDKETVDGDVIRHSPDCTGQSKDMLLRISDQVGYISKVNGKRTISWEPQDNFIGKNVAGFGLTLIPDVSSPEYKTFMATLIKGIKDKIAERMSSQEQVTGLLTDLRASLDECATDEGVAALLKEAGKLPANIKPLFFNEMRDKLGKSGFSWDGKRFVKK